MKLEHVAINHPYPQSAARWYAEYLGFRLAKVVGGPTDIHFLADDAGSMLELYRSPAAAVPDYAAMNPYTLHFALAVQDVASERARLVAGGATAVGESETNAAGDELAFLRDPWGVTLQLVRRAAPWPAR